MPIDKVVEEEVKDKELEASKDYTGLIPEVELLHLEFPCCLLQMKLFCTEFFQ